MQTDQEPKSALDLIKEYCPQILFGLGLLSTAFKGVRNFIARIWKAITGPSKIKHTAKSFEQRYLEQIVAQHKFLRLTGVRTKPGTGIELEQVYISLKLSRQDSSSRPDLPFPEEAVEGKNPDKALQERLGRRPEHQRQPEVRRSIKETLQHYRGKNLVVLGAPGSGKTTLLTYMALNCAQGEADQTLGLDKKTFPILIQLRDVARSGLSLNLDHLPKLVTTQHIIDESKQTHGGEDYIHNFFLERLKSGRCLVLLDGMDEVPDETQRHALAKQIDDLVSSYPHNLYVVSSRPSGYAGVSLGGFTVLEVADFEQADIEAFAGKWSEAIELADTPPGAEATAKAKAAVKTRELLEAVRTNPRVRQLLTNPLLLTIVATIHRYRATLPQRRTELYDEATQVLLGYWDQAKGIAGDIEPTRKRNILAEVAHAMHQRKSRSIANAKLIPLLQKAFEKAGVPPAEAHGFLTQIQDRSGLLVEVGPQLWGFSHLTFQEYLTALYLREQPDGQAFLLDKQQRYDPWWREVILLYCGLGNSRSFIDALLTEDNLFKTNLLLAAYCLTDSTDRTHALKVATQFKTCIEQPDLGKLRELGFEGLVAVAQGTATRQDGLNTLLELSHNSDWSVRESAAQALGQVGQGNPQVIQRLLGLSYDSDELVRFKVSRALGQVGQGNPQVEQRLLELFRDPEGLVRSSAAYALSQVRKGNPEMILQLLQLSRDSDRFVRSSATYSLGQVGQGDSRIVQRLLDLTHDSDKSVRESATQALGRVGKGNSQVIQRLLEIPYDLDWDVRQAAAFAISQVAQGNPQVVDSLLEIFGNSAEDVQDAIGYALGQVGQGNPQVIQRLLELSNDSEMYVRSSAAYALGQVGQGNPQVIQRLLELSNNSEMYVRSSAAYALGQVGQGNPQVIQRLLELSYDLENIVRSNTADALAQVGQGNPQVIQRLLELSNDSEESVRSASIYALSHVGPGNLQVIQHLLEVSRNLEVNTQESAADALEFLSQNSGELSLEELTMFKTWLADQKRMDYAWNFLWGHAQATGNYDLL